MRRLVSFSFIRILAGVVGIALPVTFARWMTVNDFATYTILISSVSLLIVICSLGFDRVAYRYLPKAKHGLGLKIIKQFLVFGMVFRGALAMSLGMLLFVLLQQDFMLDLTGFQAAGFKEYYFAGLLFTFLLMGNDTLIVMLNALLYFEKQALLSLINIIIRLLLLFFIVIVAGNISIISALIVTLSTEFLLMLAMLSLVILAMRRYISVKPLDEGYQSPSLREMSKVGFANYTSYFFSIPWQGSAQRLLVGVWGTVSEVASFGLIQNLADRGKMYLPLQLLQPAIEPSLVAAYSGEHVENSLKSVANVLDLLRRLNVIVLGLPILIMSIAGTEILNSVTGNKYGDYWFIAVAVCFQLAITSVSSALWTSYNVAHKMPRLSKVSAIVSIVLLPIYIIIAKHFGSLGIAVICAFPTLILFIVLRWYLKDSAAFGLWKIKQDFKVLISIFISGILALGVKALLFGNLGLISSILLGVTAYLFMIFKLKVVLKEELLNLIEMVRHQK
ncbi:MAG: hypothetical protein HOP04_14350 [Methylophilaceae bacterium]|nr:hypothetical protein [Methylophilaceae bacterium]